MTELKERYAPGKRKNSFFEEMPAVETKQDRNPVVTGGVFRYAYYTDSDGSLVKERLR